MHIKPHPQNMPVEYQTQMHEPKNDRKTVKPFTPFKKKFVYSS